MGCGDNEREGVANKGRQMGGGRQRGRERREWRKDIEGGRRELERKEREEGAVEKARGGREDDRGVQKESEGWGGGG
jgi:hypothetical protein